MENLGPFNSSAVEVLSELGCRISSVVGVDKEAAVLFK
jgi:hypothetical protein